MTLRGRPIGIVALALWSVLQAAPGMWLALGASGKAAALGWALFAGEIAVAVGLLVPIRVAWFALLAYLSASVLGFAAVLWVSIFIAAAWGLHSSELLAAVGGGVYFLFLCWAFVYLFHPGVEAYFRGSVNAPMT